MLTSLRVHERNWQFCVTKSQCVQQKRITLDGHEFLREKGTNWAVIFNQFALFEGTVLAGPIINKYANVKVICRHIFWVQPYLKQTS